MSRILAGLTIPVIVWELFIVGRHVDRQWLPRREQAHGNAVLDNVARNTEYSILKTRECVVPRTVSYSAMSLWSKYKGTMTIRIVPHVPVSVVPSYDVTGVDGQNGRKFSNTIIVASADRVTCRFAPG